jgi:hypothetical protein
MEGPHRLRQTSKGSRVKNKRLHRLLESLGIRCSIVTSEQADGCYIVWMKLNVDRHDGSDYVYKIDDIPTGIDII